MKSDRENSKEDCADVVTSNFTSSTSATRNTGKFYLPKTAPNYFANAPLHRIKIMMQSSQKWIQQTITVTLSNEPPRVYQNLEKIVIGNTQNANFVIIVHLWKTTRPFLNLIRQTKPHTRKLINDNHSEN
ncbi:hypothetical protein Bhyg_02777 [Pseudolycoriella hygida]|uniref:Uncharacterized protein n=1 Tax=Pseudolycoriella hygida TaxID=35572 RepID=A0A9Q0NDW9_9DIPT|nr:hypothetical protein Bhyg_02777 [Pseudolycoriella hygida]